MRPKGGKRSIKSLVYGRPHSSATPFLQHILQPFPPRPLTPFPALTHRPWLLLLAPHALTPVSVPAPHVLPVTLSPSPRLFTSLTCSFRAPSPPEHGLPSTTGVASRVVSTRARTRYPDPPLDGDGGRERESRRKHAVGRGREFV